jgi:hypothetical protein
MIQLTKMAGDDVEEGEVAADFWIGRVVDYEVKENE